jgi:hypothetical protein
MSGVGHHDFLLVVVCGAGWLLYVSTPVLLPQPCARNREKFKMTKEEVEVRWRCRVGVHGVAVVVQAVQCGRGRGRQWGCLQ